MKRNVMKNLWRFLAVLPLRVRGSQRELRTPPPSTDSRLSVVFICHLGFGIWNLFSIRPLTFENCLPASVHQPPRLANTRGGCARDYSRQDVVRGFSLVPWGWHNPAMQRGARP